MRTVAIIQARTGSTRLPSKVLLDIAGQPMLAHVVERAQRAELIDEVVVATTTESGDDPVEQLCQASGWQCFRGQHHNVLDRYYQAATRYEAEAVVRITSDCPVIDSGLIDQVVATFQMNRDSVDYVANILPPRTYPRGLDVEAFSFTALREAWEQAADSASREHVTMFIYRNQDRFRCQGVRHDVDESARRWTVDTPDDLRLIRAIYDSLGDHPFGWQQILAAAQAHPEWTAINGHIEQRAA